MSNFKKRYRDLEMEVHNSLRNAINNSSIESVHMNTKAIRLDKLSNNEVVIIDDRLILVDRYGHHHSIFSVSLENLIDAI